MKIAFRNLKHLECRLLNVLLLPSKRFWHRADAELIFQTEDSKLDLENLLNVNCVIFMPFFKSCLRSDRGCIQSCQSSGACGDFAAEGTKKEVHCFATFFSSSLSFLLVLPSDKYLKRSNPNEGTEPQVPEVLMAAGEPVRLFWGSSFC